MSRRRSRERPIFAPRGPFAVECPGCREPAGCARELVGSIAGCPRCRRPFIVPDPDAEPASPGPPRGPRNRDRSPGTAFDSPAGAPPRAAATPSSAPVPDPAPVPAPGVARSRGESPAPASSRAAGPAPHPAASRDTSADTAAPLVFSDPPIPSTRLRTGHPPAATPNGSAAAVTADRHPPEPAAVAAAQDPIVVAPDAGPAVTVTSAPPPQAESAGAGLAFQEPVKTIRSGGEEIEIRRLTPEEKRVRRARRNLLILLVGATLLVVLVVVLGTRGR